MSGLIMITNTYPYSTVGDSFVHDEIEHLSESFDEIVIVPTDHVPEWDRGERQMPSNVSVLPSLGVNQRRGWRVRCSQALDLLSPNAMAYILRKRGMGLIRVARGTVSRMDKGKVIGKAVLREVQRLGPGTVVYSYWLDKVPPDMSMIRGEGGVVCSRAHRGDLYQEMRDPPIIPFQDEIVDQLDLIVPISSHGERYLRERCPACSDRVEVHRLGVPDPGFMTLPSDDGVIRVVSCSFISEVKRIDLLIGSLAHLGRGCPHLSFEWRHIGTGGLREEMETMATQELPPNVSHDFLGMLPVGGVIDHYRRNRVDLFINVSRSEGVPVSIMEAQSCGIPVVATAVGGTPEIVNGEVGRLVPSDPSPEEVAEAVLDVIGKGVRPRVGSRRNWAKRYDAWMNHTAFAERLSGLPWKG